MEKPRFTDREQLSRRIVIESRVDAAILEALGRMGRVPASASITSLMGRGQAILP